MRLLNLYPASPKIEEKLEQRHGVQFSDVEEVFRNDPKISRGPRDQYGEYRYRALGQTDAGRYLAIIFVPMAGWRAKVITARDMDNAERRQYRRGK